MIDRKGWIDIYNNKGRLEKGKEIIYLWKTKFVLYNFVAILELIIIY